MRKLIRESGAVVSALVFTISAWLPTLADTGADGESSYVVHNADGSITVAPSAPHRLNCPEGICQALFNLRERIDRITQKNGYGESASVEYTTNRGSYSTLDPSHMGIPSREGLGVILVHLKNGGALEVGYRQIWCMAG